MVSSLLVGFLAGGVVTVSSQKVYAWFVKQKASAVAKVEQVTGKQL